MDRMSMMDAAFLYSEDGKSHNDVGMVLLFDGPALTREEVMQVIADRIALVPTIPAEGPPHAVRDWAARVDGRYGLRYVAPRSPSPGPAGAAPGRGSSLPGYVRTRWT